MKKLFFIVVLGLIGVLVYFFLVSNKLVSNKKDEEFDLMEFTHAIIVSPSVDPQQKTKSEQSLFVPYWTLTNQPVAGGGFGRFIYFGVTANDKGIDRNEEGYKKIELFTKLVSGEKWLTIRMINSSYIFPILKDASLQKKIIDDTISLAKDNQFSGIVLDLEVSALPLPGIVNQMNTFVSSFQTGAHAQKLQFGMTLFGDTFYRIRPYDVATLAKSADVVYIMAYDFHKAGGDPGPNFPFAGKDTFGYDFKTMTSDFLALVPAQKLNVVFGLFGYDWPVDENGKSIKQADSLSESAIKNKFLSNCSFAGCSVVRDSQSAETKITYTDANGARHVVWFEDLQSVAKKKAYLQENGIYSTSLWAYSYF